MINQLCGLVPSGLQDDGESGRKGSSTRGREAKRYYARNTPKIESGQKRRENEKKRHIFALHVCVCVCQEGKRKM
jgi:hypothetical protein